MADQPRVPAGPSPNPHGGEFASKGTAMPDGDKLASAARLYGEYHINASKVSFASAAIIDGRSMDSYVNNKDFAGHPDDYEAAKVLVDAVRASEEKEQTLYRGVHEGGKGFEAIKNLQIGDTFAIGRISSFSEQRHTASGYASRNVYDGRNTKGLMLVLKGKSQTFATDSHSGMGHKEHVTEGKFRVVDIVKKIEPVVYPEGWSPPEPGFKYEIIIEQLGVY